MLKTKMIERKKLMIQKRNGKYPHKKWKRSNQSGISWGFYGQTHVFGPGTFISGWSTMGKQSIHSTLVSLLEAFYFFLLYGSYGKVETTLFSRVEIKSQL